MKKYPLTAVVKRVVEDTISLHVEAATEAEALAKATHVLDVYPRAHDIEGVDYCYVENRETFSSEIVSLEQKEDKGVA